MYRVLGMSKLAVVYQSLWMSDYDLQSGWIGRFSVVLSCPITRRTQFLFRPTWFSFNDVEPFSCSPSSLAIFVGFKYMSVAMKIRDDDDEKFGGRRSLHIYPLLSTKIKLWLVLYLTLPCSPNSRDVFPIFWTNQRTS